jgi:hypothetical protein
MVSFMVVVPFCFENLQQQASRLSLAVASPVFGQPPPQAEPNWTNSKVSCLRADVALGGVDAVVVDSGRMNTF